MAKPAQSWRMKGVDIAAWQNERGYSYTFRKTYKDKASGEYKESKYWYPDDLTILSELLSQVDKWRDARHLDRQIHEAEGVASGQGKLGPAAKHEEYDDIPF